MGPGAPAGWSAEQGLQVWGRGSSDSQGLIWGQGLFVSSKSALMAAVQGSILWALLPSSLFLIWSFVFLSPLCLSIPISSSLLYFHPHISFHLPPHLSSSYPVSPSLPVSSSLPPSLQLSPLSLQLSPVSPSLPISPALPLFLLLSLQVSPLSLHLPPTPCLQLFPLPLQLSPTLPAAPLAAPPLTSGSLGASARRPGPGLERSELQAHAAGSGGGRRERAGRTASSQGAGRGARAGG